MRLFTISAVSYRELHVVAETFDKAVKKYKKYVEKYADEHGISIQTPLELTKVDLVAGGSNLVL